MLAAPYSFDVGAPEHQLVLPGLITGLRKFRISKGRYPINWIEMNMPIMCSGMTTDPRRLPANVDKRSWRPLGCVATYILVGSSQDLVNLEVHYPGAATLCVYEKHTLYTRFQWRYQKCTRSG